MRRAHGQLLLLGIFVFIDIAASAALVRRLQDCLFVDLAGGRDCLANLDAVLKPALAATLHCVVTTTSRYSLGTIRVSLPPRFIRSSNSMISASRAPCPAESSAANARLVGP
jgi:hypothetical protein